MRRWKNISLRTIFRAQSVVSLTSQEIRKFSLMFKTFQGCNRRFKVKSLGLRRHRAYQLILKNVQENFAQKDTVWYSTE